MDLRPGIGGGVTIGLIRRLVSTKRWATDLSIVDRRAIRTPFRG
jgi:hypothetical protein